MQHREVKTRDDDSVREIEKRRQAAALQGVLRAQKHWCRLVFIRG